MSFAFSRAWPGWTPGTAPTSCHGASIAPVAGSDAVSRVGDTLEDDVDRMRKVVLSGIGEVRQALSEAATALRDLGD